MSIFRGQLAFKGMCFGIFGLSVAARSALALDASCPTMPLTPQPAPTPTIQVNNDITGRSLVSGSMGMDRMGSFLMAQGDQVYVVATPAVSPVPSGSPTPCPTPTWSPRFSPIAVSADKYALVTIWGTSKTFNNASIYFSDNDGMQTGGAIALSDTPPAGYPAAIAPKAMPTGTDIVGKYFLLKIASGTSTTQRFSYRSPSNGTMNFTVQTEVVGAASTAVRSVTRTTTFRPRLAFTTPARAPAVGSCSSVVTVQTVDGNGAMTPVQTGTGNIAKLGLSGSPSDLFLDSGCVYPTTTMSIADPVPAASGTRPPATISNSYVSFYFKTNAAQTFPITATYVDTDGQSIFQATQAESAQALPPIAAEISGPSAVNQGNCSAVFTVRLKDKFDNFAPMQSGRQFILSAPNNTVFYSDAACTAGLGGRLTINTGSSEASFYVKDNTAELLSFSVLDTAPAGSAVQGVSSSLRVLSTGSLAIPKDANAAKNIAIRIYDRLVGLPIALTDPNLKKMQDLIMAGKAMEAARVATNQDGFYNLTLKNMITPLSNRLYNSLEPLNDFIATWIGIVRDDRDARELMTGNHIYVGSSLKTSDDQHCANSTVYKSSAHYQGLVDNFTNLRTDLVPVRQCAYNSGDFNADYPVLLGDAAGLLTSRTWGVNHLYAGTNRRAIQYAFQVFMCKDIRDVADSSMPDWHVRRDVDRAPGGDPKVYTASCRACHGGMDALGGAYSFFDAYPNQNDGNDFRLFYVNKGGYGASAVMAKMNQNNTVFPPGWISGDDSWLNFFTDNQNKNLGWSSEVAMKGNGINGVGQMLANSAAFPACMAKRVFKEICKREADANEASILDDLSQDFQASGYNMRRLFEKTASLGVCVGNGE